VSQLLNTNEAARRLGVSAEYVRQLERTGKLPAERTTSGYRIFREADVEKLATEREQRKAKAVAELAK